MSNSKTVVVVGLGEVGKPLLELISKYHNGVGVDIVPPSTPVGNVDVLHICFPFQIPDFIGEIGRYVKMFEPKLTIINSTVAAGTTRAAVERLGAKVAYSPVRGKHARMLEDMKKYAKFVGSNDPETGQAAAEHFKSVGLRTKVLSSTEAAEVAKLSETTFFGLMIAWAQEVERYADQTNVAYEEIVSFYEEIGFFPPVKYFPGVIGGHCVMPNIKLLQRLQSSEILSAIESSNLQKIGREEKRKAANPKQ